MNERVDREQQLDGMARELIAFAARAGRLRAAAAEEWSEAASGPCLEPLQRVFDSVALKGMIMREQITRVDESLALLIKSLEDVLLPQAVANGSNPQP